MHFEEKQLLDFTKKHKKSKNKSKVAFEENDLNRLIEMAWQDRTSFDTIFELYGLTHNQVKKRMKKLLKKNSFRLWSKRISGKKTKHKKRLDLKITRFQGPW